MTATLRTQCPDCGARYSVEGDFCGARFNALLALDHSRQEPWGSRHGQAFAAYALQHPREFETSLDHAWVALHRIYVARLVGGRLTYETRGRRALAVRVARQ